MSAPFGLSMALDVEVVSKVSHEDHDAGDFKKAAVDRDQALVPDAFPHPVGHEFVGHDATS